MNVYIATSGSYSDYRIDAVFSTKEMADEYVAQSARSDALVELFECDTATMMPKGYRWYKVLMKKSRKCSCQRLEDCYRDPHSHVDAVWKHNNGEEILETLLFNVSAINEDHAIKIANEKLTIILALGLENCKSEKDVDELLSKIEF